MELFINPIIVPSYDKGLSSEHDEQSIACLKRGGVASIKREMLVLFTFLLLPDDEAQVVAVPLWNVVQSFCSTVPDDLEESSTSASKPFASSSEEK